MADNCNRALILAEEVLTGFGLNISVSAQESGDGCALNFSGEDSSLLRFENGELLDSIEHLLNQILLNEGSSAEKIVCDVDNFRSDREAELRAMAKHAAQQVNKLSKPFYFAPMNSKERRIIHLALADDAGVVTDSVGEGNQRRVRVSKK